ncbi:radical SAM protein [Verrucomicrobiota bacterium]
MKKWAMAALRAAFHRTGAVNLIVTRRCDLACPYCYARRDGPELLPGDWLRIAEILSSRFAAFTVSGGEPLLYDGLPDLVNGLSRIGIAGLCTNARIIEEAHLAAMHGLDYLNFSIDHTGDSAASEKTAFGKIPLMAEYARKNSYELFGTAVITCRNVDSIPAVVRKLADHGIPTNLQLIQNPASGYAFDTPEKLSQLNSLQDELLSLKRNGYPIEESVDYIQGLVPFVKGERSVICHAGDTYLAVDTDGRLMPCQDAPAVGMPLQDMTDAKSALHALRGSAPSPCRCWWNCYHRYESWRRSPLRFILSSFLDRARNGVKP